MEQFPAVIANEIDLQKTLVDELLSRKFGDQSYLLGINNNIQGKFQAWILSDSNKYYQNVENSSENNTIEFNTLKYFEILWTKFHYPIIKYFQYELATLFNENLQEFNELFKNKDSKQKVSFKVKSVEIRKIHDNLTKFLKQAHQFYFNLLQHFSTRYQNGLIPIFFLQNFDFVPSPTSYPISVPDVRANFLSLIHHCLLSLGNLARHRSFIELSYVNPCLSNSNFWKYRNLTPKSKGVLMKPFYKKAIRYYNYCIALIPALNEPYNHIGIIHNFYDDKFNAIYWFLRSNFSRIPNYTLGLNNFFNIMKKKFTFTDYLVDFYQDEKKGSETITKEKLHMMLICLIGYHYLPDVYHNGPYIVKQIKYTKVENDFFQLCFNKLIENLKNSNKKKEQELETKENSAAKESEVLLKNSFPNSLFNPHPEITDSIDIHFQHFIMLSCFQKLAQESDDQDALLKLNRFILRYIDNSFFYFTQCLKDRTVRTKVLIVTRFVFNWLRENKEYLKFIHTKKYTLDIISGFLNTLLGSLSGTDVETQESEEFADLESQDSRFVNTIELITSNSRPSRVYFFKEDIVLKDFSIIGFQFKDFKDDHLFKSRNINLLNGDFSVYFHTKKTSKSPENKFSDKIPTFFDNSVALRIASVLETCKNDAAVERVIRAEIERYEQDARIQAILVLGAKLLQSTNNVIFNKETHRFVVILKKDLAEKQRVKILSVDGERSKAKPKGKRDRLEIETKPKHIESKLQPKIATKTWASEITNKPEVQVISSEDEEPEKEGLDDLEDVIRTHASRLQGDFTHSNSSFVSAQQSMEEIVDLQKEREMGLQNMVDSLVLEPEQSATSKTEEDTQKEQFFSLPPVLNSPNIWNNQTEHPGFTPFQQGLAPAPAAVAPVVPMYPNQAPNQFSQYPQYQNSGFPSYPGPQYNYPYGQFNNMDPVMFGNPGFANFAPIQNPQFPPQPPRDPQNPNEYPQYQL